MIRKFAALAIAAASLVAGPAHAVSGTISTNTTLGPGTVPVESDITVNSGVTLTIAAGTTLSYYGNYTFIVNGSLVVAGAEGSTVQFNGGRGIKLMGGSGPHFFDYAYFGACNGPLDATPGGAISVLTTNTVTISNSVFEYNQSTSHGGAIYVNDNGVVDISDTRFVGNYAPNYGGAVCAWTSAVVTYTRCEFNNNSASQIGGAVYASADGSFTDCLVVGNSADLYGGGAVLAGAHSITGSLIAENYSPQAGGGIYAGSDLAIDRCTIANNVTDATYGGGVVQSGGTATVIENSILWGNAPNGWSVVSGSAPTVDYTLSQDTFTGTGNLNVDPLFIDAAKGDYTLSPVSPAIDAGDPGSGLDPDGTRADMGAFAITQAVASGATTDNVVWGPGTVRVTGDYTVSYGDTLVINPGTDVSFQGDYTVTVIGQISAVGTESDSIRFLPADGVANWGGMRIAANYSTHEFAYTRFSGSRADAASPYNSGGAIYLVATGDTLRLSNSVISGNYAANNSGAVHLEGTSTHAVFTDCRIENNQSVSYGGVTRLWNGATAEFIRCDVIGNVSSVSGGAVFAQGNVDVTDSRFIGNFAGSLPDSSGNGGAILIGNGQTLNLTGAIFYDNGAGGSGGAISTSSSAPVIADRCTFYGNYAGRTVTGGGGAINNFVSSTTTVITNSIIWNNEPNGFYTPLITPTVTYSITQDGWAGEGNVSADPQLIDPANGDFSLAAASPAVNAGDPNSGSDPDGTVADMGAVYREAPTIGGFYSNLSLTPADGPIVVTSMVYLDGTLDIAPGTTLLFNQNTGIYSAGAINAVGTASDSILFVASGDSSWNGITIDTFLPIAKISEAAASGDTATFAFARIANAATMYTGGGIFVYGGGKHLSLSNVVVEDCYASGNGGGIYLSQGNTGEFTNCVLRNNETSAQGGGIYVDQTSLILTNTLVENNISTGDGGGVFIYNDSYSEIVDCAFIGNVSNGGGGGLAAVGGDGGGEVPARLSRESRLRGKERYRNPIPAKPALVGDYIHPVVYVSGSLFDSNTATSWGGGAVAYYAEFYGSECMITNNHTDGYGGGWEIQDQTQSLLDDCQFIGNSAVEDGGGFEIWGAGSVGEVTNCLISGNVAVDAAGAFFGLGSEVAVSKTEFSGNTTAYLNEVSPYYAGGGAFVLYDGLLSVTQTTIVDNADDVSGLGAVYASADEQASFTQTVLDLNSSIIWNNSPIAVGIDTLGGDSLAVVSARYSIVQGGAAIGFKPAWPDTGNFDADPLFVDAASGDYTLLNTSPSIDTGDPALPYDEDGTRADIGAYPYITPYGDVTGDGSVTANDASAVLQYVVGKTMEIDSRVADVTGNGTVSPWDASHILRLVVDPGYLLPVEQGGMTRRPSSGAARYLSWEKIDGGFALMIDDPNGVEAGTFTLQLPAETKVAVESDEMFGYSREDDVIRLAFVRIGTGEAELFRLVGTGPMSAPEITSMSLNEGTVEARVGVPLQFTLFQNAPNPFNPVTTLRFTVPEAGHVNLAIYDVNGRIVRTLIDGEVAVGMHEVSWHGTDDVGREVGSGMYIYRISAGGQALVRKMTLLR